MLKNLSISCIISFIITSIYVGFANYHNDTAINIAKVVVPVFFAIASFSFSILIYKETKKIASGNNSKELLNDFNSSELIKAKEEWSRITEMAFTGENSSLDQFMPLVESVNEDEDFKATNLGKMILQDICNHFSSYDENEKVKPLFQFIAQVSIALDSNLVTEKTLKLMMEDSICELLKFGAFYLSGSKNNKEALYEQIQSINQLAKVMGVTPWTPDSEFRTSEHQ